MSRTITAIFDFGEFRPREPVDLAEGAQALVPVGCPAPELANDGDAETQQAWREYLDRVESLPGRSPSDGLANRDHDGMIYGG